MRGGVLPLDDCGWLVGGPWINGCEIVRSSQIKEEKKKDCV